jgi:hypothetical protein
LAGESACPTLIGGGAFGDVGGLAVAVEAAGEELEEGGGGEPDLPVREGTGGDVETGGPAEVGGDAPEAEGEGHDGAGGQEGGEGDGDTLVFAMLFCNTGASRKSDPDYHGGVHTNLAIFAID